MLRLSKKVVFTFIVATLSGACLHFLYELFPNPFTALVSPVNESLWEHLKILYWPGLISILFLHTHEGKECLQPRLLGLLLAGAAMLAVGYLYHIPWNGEALGFDVCLYVLAMAAAFLLPALFPKPLPKHIQSITRFLTVALGIAILLFTFVPPELLLFADLSGVHTWVRLPC